MVVISDRQEKLHLRHCRIMVEDPVTIESEWRDTGIGRCSFIYFCNGSRRLSRNTLNVLERYIIQREKELGL